MSLPDLDYKFWREMPTELGLGADFIVLDLGAHKFEEGAAVMPCYPRCRWIAFEPHPLCAAHILKFIRDNPSFSNAILVEKAVGDHVGKTILYRSGGHPTNQPDIEWTHSSSTRKPKMHLVYHPWITFDEGIEVEMTTLDSYCKDMPKIDFIKVDVQGAEIDVVRGGQETLKRARFLLCETTDAEIYEGQANKAHLLAALPVGWAVKKEFQYDTLYERNKIPGQNS